MSLYFPSLANVDKLAEILLTYGHFDSNELGYAQGMSDMMAPLFVIQEGDDVRTFWCFVEFMERMVSSCAALIRTEARC